MKKLLSSTALIIGLLAAAPAHAMPVEDLITEAATAASSAIDEAMKTITTKWQEFMQSTTGQTLKQVEETVKKVQGVTDKIQDVYDKAYGYMNDPAGSVKSLALGQEKTKAEQYLPESYTDESIKTFKVGKADTAIKESAEKTLALIKEEPDTFSLTGDKRGTFETSIKDRDAREAAYYLAMTEEAYFQASQRYEELGKDYEQRIKNANEVKDKLNLQNELQSKQLMLQSQLIQLTALKQTHEARKEVAEERKKQLQKNKMNMKQISVL
jgi:hypothetical protein